MSTKTQRPTVPLIELTEYECTTQAFPFSPQEITWFQEHLQDKITLLPTARPGYYHLRVGPYVGSLSLPHKIVVIKPKMPLVNLFYLLSVASAIPFQQERSFYAQSNDWFEFLVHLFLAETEKIIRGGIQAGYFLQEEALPFIREKLLFHHIQRYPTLRHRPHCRFSEYTPDILENQAVKWTLFLLQQRYYSSVTISHTLRRLLSCLVPVSLVEITPLTLAKVTYTHRTERYRIVLHLAQLLLRHLTLCSQPGGAPFYAFLVNMNWLFETFITQSLATLLRQKEQVTVALQHRTFLDTAEIVPIRIDLLLQSGKTKRIIVDTKYKRLTALSEQTNDLYQVLGYCLATGGQEAVLIYPYGEMKEQHLILEANNLQIHGLTIDLTKPVDHLAAEVGRIAEKLLTFVR